MKYKSMEVPNPNKDFSVDRCLSVYFLLYAGPVCNTDEKIDRFFTEFINYITDAVKEKNEGKFYNVRYTDFIELLLDFAKNDQEYSKNEHLRKTVFEFIMYIYSMSSKGYNNPYYIEFIGLSIADISLGDYEYFQHWYAYSEPIVFDRVIQQESFYDGEYHYRVIDFTAKLTRSYMSNGLGRFSCYNSLMNSIIGQFTEKMTQCTDTDIQVIIKPVTGIPEGETVLSILKRISQHMYEEYTG